MYVARKAFRNYNQMILPGSVVEPASIKWFKTRLKDRVIIEVTPHNLAMWNEYFEQKFGVSLKKQDEKQDKEPVKEPIKEPVKGPVRVTAIIK